MLTILDDSDDRQDGLIGGLLSHFMGKATLKHVYVYSMLGLVDERLNVKPDYSIPYQQVYVDYTFNIMQASSSLVTLLFSQPHASTGPSWSIDCSLSESHISGKSCDGQRYFAADKGIGWLLARKTPGQIVINGIVLDEIKSLSPFSGRPDPGWLRDAARFYHAATSPGGTPEQEVLTMPADLVRTLTRESRAYAHTIKSTELLANREWRMSQQELELWKRRFEAVLRGFADETSIPGSLQLSWNETLFRTTRGCLGISQGSIEVGNKLCVLGGLKSPFILRPVSQPDGQVAYKAGWYVLRRWHDGWSSIGDSPGTASRGRQECRRGHRAYRANLIANL